MDLSTDNDNPLTGVCTMITHGKCPVLDKTALSPHGHQRAGRLKTAGSSAGHSTMWLSLRLRGAVGMPL